LFLSLHVIALQRQIHSTHSHPSQHHAPPPPPPSQLHPSQNYPPLSQEGSGGNVTEQRKRGESIDMFLSRSPSQSLGSEFLKFRKDENLEAIPSLALDGSGSAGGYDLNKSIHSQSHSQYSVGMSVSGGVGNGLEVHVPIRSIHGARSGSVGGGTGGDMSPSCSVTGTTGSSRSASPSWHSNDGRRGGSAAGSSVQGGANTILAYNQQSMDVKDFASAEGMIPFQSSRGQISAHQDASFSMAAGVTNLTGVPQVGISSSGMQSMPLNYVSADPYDYQDNHDGQLQQQHQIPQQIHPSIPLPQAYMLPNHEKIISHHGGGGGGGIMGHHSNGPDHKSQQGQVFYVAVPTQDGQGQVLQPIQMVQLPGQPNAFVLPSSGGSMPFQPSQQGAGNMQQAHYVASQGGNHGYMNRENRPMKQAQYYPTPGTGIDATVNSARTKSYATSTGAGRVHVRDSSYEDQPPYPFVDEPISQHGGDTPFGENLASQQHRDNLRKDLLSNNEIVASLYASPKRPPLRELLGHVRRLSRDQVGCRLLQQALDEEGDTAATAILNEGLSFWGEAMVDPFGNYLFQKILEKITPTERILLVKTVSPRLVNASLNLHGTRSVQKVVELCAIDEVNASYQHSITKEESNQQESDDAKVLRNNTKKNESAAEILTKALTPAAARLCIDSHGNHVIQRILLKLPYRYSHFVFDAVANSVGDVARHRHGCCVIQRCLDSPPSAARSNLVCKIVEKSLELMQDAYGNYVVQYVLDVCSDEDVHSVCESVVGKVALLAIQKFSSNVMEKCLERCTDKVREAYLEELSDQEKIRELMMDPFGNYVIQRALAVASHTQALKLVDAMRPHLISSNGGGIRNTAGGRRILAKIERRFPHFNINEEGSIERVIHRKGGANHETQPITGGPQRGSRRGQKRMTGKEVPQHQKYRNFPHNPTPHAMNPNYFMMGGDPRNYEHM
jgi:RNA-binding protein of the Puf family, translational repressor